MRMSLRKALLAATMLALPVAAGAQPISGLYVGGGFGLNWMLDSDVDLWVEAPGDVPVGYANKGGAVFNLLRDDLGNRADATGLNYETSYSRGILPGEYTVNLHLYRNSSRTFPVPVTVVTSVKSEAENSTKQMLASKVELTREGEEMTVYRFQLTEAGGLVGGSVHSLFKELRSRRKS